jgi:hypothetical protein
MCDLDQGARYGYRVIMMRTWGNDNVLGTGIYYRQ